MQIPGAPVGNSALGKVAGDQSAISQPTGQKDAKDSSTEAKFGDVWKNLEAKYGAKPEKAREIKKTLGKDDFLRIMITQMQHQDPTQPFKAEQMASEMAQYTSVEQLQNMNSQLAKLSTQNQPLERMAMTNLIGKKVTVDRERFPHAENTKDTLSFTLPKEAKEAKITIVNEAGEAVFEKELGPLKKGSNDFVWEGAKTNSLPAKGGNYIYQVDAKDADGQSIQLNPQGQARVVGVSFEGGEPLLLIGDINKPDKVALRNVIRIETDLAQPQFAQLGNPSPAAEAVAPAPKAPQAMFSFTKGEGSRNLDAAEVADRLQNGKISSEAARALMGGAAGSAAPARPQVAAADSGFPNGLHEGEELNTQNNQPKGGEKR